MTRDNEIANAASVSMTETLMSTPNYEFSPKATDILECAYIKGAEWADKHPVNPWHSVADGDFPKEDKDICIAVTEYGSIFIVYFVRHANGGIFYNYNEHTNIDIKYWMEIPELPKKGGEE